MTGTARYAVVVAVLFVGLSSVAGAQTAPDACALLTVAEVSASVGQHVSGPNPSHTDDGGGRCMYVFGAMDQVGIEVWHLPSAAAAQKRFAQELKAAQGKASLKTTVETGVGDRAFLTTGARGAMKAVTWTAFKGSRFFHVVAFGEDGVPPDHLSELMVKALGR